MHQINIFYEAEQQWLDHARRKAVELLRRQKDRPVTIEDVLRICPRPIGVRRNANSRVFKNDVFRPYGYDTAKHTAAHHRAIRTWTLNAAYFPEEDTE